MESFHYNSSRFDTHPLRIGWFHNILLVSMWKEDIQNFRSISQTILDLEQLEICQISLTDITKICDQFEHFYVMRSRFFFIIIKSWNLQYHSFKQWRINIFEQICCKPNSSMKNSQLNMNFVKKNNFEQWTFKSKFLQVCNNFSKKTLWYLVST